MRAFARRSTADFSQYETFEPDDNDAQWELTPGERVCPPSYGSSGKAKLRGGFLLLIALGCGWLLFPREHLTWEQWLPADISALLAEFTGPETIGPETIGPAMAIDGEPASEAAQFGSLPQPEPIAAVPPSAAAAAMEPPVEAELQDVPFGEAKAEQGGDADDVDSSPVVINAETYPGTSEEQAEPEVTPLPPAEADPSDPLQVRAASAGLHPGLSRVLLGRLSPADYKNAQKAIRTALAETPNDGTFLWPRQRKPELALFKVHFVPGAAPGCRRYVVTITKDGWSTTALPMENCDARPSRSAANRTSPAQR